MVLLAIMSIPLPMINPHSIDTYDSDKGLTKGRYFFGKEDFYCK